jgi:L-threonylcarbamoyladenylate synthase
MGARILEATAENVARAAAAVRRGEPVAMPTETVYGLAASVWDEAALRRVFEVKGRPWDDPLIVHVSLPLLAAAGGGSPSERLVGVGLVDGARVTARARACADALLDRFWPGPLTLVLPKSARVPDLATAGLATVAVRMPRHPVAQALIDAVGAPLAAPSANRFGRVSPTSAGDVALELGDRLEIILDGGPCPVGLESTVVEIDPGGAVRVLRPGGVTREEIARVAGGPPEAAPPAARSASPGTLGAHYSPSKRLWLLPSPAGALRPEDLAPAGPLPPVLGLLVLAGDAGAAARAFERTTGRKVVARALAPSGSDEEAAQALFAALRALDGSEAGLLFAEPCPEDTGLWHAIADRLRRASGKARKNHRQA